MKKNLICIAITAISVCVMMTNCGSKKQVSVMDKKGMQKEGGQGITLIEELPCQSTGSSIDYIVVNAEGKSKDRTMAKDKAYINALSQLGLKLDGVNSTKNMQVKVSVDGDNTEDYHAKTVVISKNVVKNISVAGYRTTCEKYAIENGSYICFVTVEYNKQKIVKQLYEEMKAKSLIRANYDFDKYMDAFEEELKAYEQNKY